MTTQDTQHLIETLAGDAPPVKRLRPPLLRAGIWLLCLAIPSAAAIAAFADLGVFAQRIHHPELVVELIATLATGCLAVIAAFELSLPDRSPHWALLPIPTLGIWLGASGAGCYRQFLIRGMDGSWQLGESGDCFMFILGLGLPLTLALLWALRRARPINPLPVAVTGALGAAALAAFLLQFFHPFDVTLMDLAIHACAVALLVLMAAGRGRMLLK